MSRSEKGALAAMIVFGVLLMMEYVDKCIAQSQGFTVTTALAAGGLLMAGAVFVLRGRGQVPPQ